MDKYIRKLRAKLPTITCKRELQKALGLLNVMRPFIPGLAKLLSPFYALTKQGLGRVDWGQIYRDFLPTWTGALSTAMALTRHEPMVSAHYVLYTDWSGNGMGFALYAGDRVV